MIPADITIDPTCVREIESLIREYAEDIQHRNLVLDEDEDDVVLELTIGYSPESKTWGWQTGDNSFVGGAYSHPIWSVVYIDKWADPAHLVRDCINEIEEMLNV